MSASSVRRGFAAGVTALALIGAGAGAAFAADTITPDQYYAGTVHLALSSDASNVAEGTQQLAYITPVIALVNASDITSKFPIPAGATSVRSFLAPQGHESTIADWDAAGSIALTPGGILTPNLAPQNLNIIGTGALAGTNTVKAVGGSFSIGIAFLTNNNVTIVPGGLYFAHITVQPGGAYTYQTTAVQRAAITTTIDSATPASPTDGDAITLAAHVSSTAATGTVDFKADGTQDLGSASVSGGNVTLDVAAGTLAAGTHSIVATYSGSDFTDATGSAPFSLTVAGTPQGTTTTITATPASGDAFDAIAYAVTVTAANSSIPTGSVDVSASNGTSSVDFGSFPVTAGTNEATVATSNTQLGAGTWTVTAAFTGTGVYQPSNGTTSVQLVAVGASDTSDVTTTLPEGTLTITTPYAPGHALDLGVMKFDQTDSTYYTDPVAFGGADDGYISVMDRRTGAPGWTAKVQAGNFVMTGASTLTMNRNEFSSQFASLAGVALDHADNAGLTGGIHASDVSNLSVNSTFASLAATADALGSASFKGTIALTGVPTSLYAGTYGATLTFTAQ